MKFVIQTLALHKCCVAVCLSVAMCTTEANAILMVSLTNYDSHKALSADSKYRFAASIEITRTNGSIVRSSGVAIAPNLVLTAAHAIPSTTSTSVVSGVLFGPNVLAPGALRFNASRWERYPGYSPGSANYHTLDFGLIYLDQFIPNFQPITFGSVTVGEVLTIVGYGGFAELYASALELTLGDRLAGYAPVYNWTSSPWPSTSYLHTFFSLNSTTSSLRAMGIPGDSGGPYFNADGHIVGIHTGQSNGFAGGFGAALRTSNPDFLDYVTPRVAASWADFYAQLKPELRDVFIQAPAADNQPKFSGTVVNGPPLGTARLQASLDLGTSDPWADVASVTLDAGGSATFTNIPDSRPQALGSPSNYFRVVTEAPSNP